MFLIILILILKIIHCSCFFVLTPLDHTFCVNRDQKLVSNRLTVDYTKLSIKIEPNISSITQSSINALCPITTIQSGQKSVNQLLDGIYESGYWHLAMKISGEFSSCKTFLAVGELNSDYNKSEILNIQKIAKRFDCRSQLPVFIPGKLKQFAIWWWWEKEILPRIQIDVLPYFRYIGDFNIEQKMKICVQAMGFWCGELCIYGRMRCDGINDCTIMSQSTMKSSDEVDCLEYYNHSENFGNERTGDSFWINNILYISLGLVGVILICSACKIYMTNSVLLKRFRRKMQLSTMNSPLYSLSPGDSEDEGAYEDIQKYNENDSKKNSSLMISGDEETQETITASKEYIDSVYNNNVFHPQLRTSSLENGEMRTQKFPARVELHSLSSYQLQDSSSLTTISTNISLTGNILNKSQNIISEMNSPGSSRTFRKIFNKQINKTSSYDKILMNSDALSNLSCPEKDGIRESDQRGTLKNTTSRSENDHLCDNDEFPTYVIV